MTAYAPPRTTRRCFGGPCSRADNGKTPARRERAHARGTAFKASRLHPFLALLSGASAPAAGCDFMAAGLASDREGLAPAGRGVSGLAPERTVNGQLDSCRGLQALATRRAAHETDSQLSGEPQLSAAHHAEIIEETDSRTVADSKTGMGP